MHPVQAIIQRIRANDDFGDDFGDAKKRILQTECLIIDEVSMISELVLRNVEAIMRGVRKCELPFGYIH